jgi:hypothetical protein
VFAAAPHTAHPRLRRRKAAALQAEPLARGVAQADVWEEVALTAERLQVDSRTQANEDAFRAHQPSLRQLEHAFPLQAGQCGAILALGRDRCLDAVSRPDAFKNLWPKLRTGYLLDSLDRLDQPPLERDTVDGFLTALEKAVVSRRPSVGRGDDVRLGGNGVLGSGLELEGEVVQITGFTNESASARRAGRIARPSTRRDV